MTFSEKDDTVMQSNDCTDQQSTELSFFVCFCYIKVLNWPNKVFK